MGSRVSKDSAIVGVADHCGWAVLMTVGSDHSLLDRRRVELVDADLPKLPHHHECQGLPADKAVALIARVLRSAETCAAACLDALARDVPAEIAGIALRICPALPDTVAERISNYRAQTMADGIMYRQALAQAAKAKGWRVHWYAEKSVFAEAARALNRGTVEEILKQTGVALGRPWQKDHRVAMAAALAATREDRSDFSA
jgi:hypothetical protein